MISVNYNDIISNLSNNQLEDFEIESQSRQYIGYTLFSRHYHYMKHAENMEDLDMDMGKCSLTEESNDTSDDDESSTPTQSTNSTGTLSTSNDSS